MYLRNTPYMSIYLYVRKYHVIVIYIVLNQLWIKFYVTYTKKKRLCHSTDLNDVILYIKRTLLDVL